MIRTVAFFAAPLLLAATAFAAPGVPGNPDPKAAQTGTYAVEPSHTRVQFSVAHMGFTDWYGDFTHVSGSLKLDTAHVDQSAVDITIPVDSATTTNAKLDGELKSADWFDAGQYPTIRFVSTKVVRAGADRAAITGNLTFHGVTRPVTLEAHFNGAGINPMNKAESIGFNATTTLKRSDFGVKTYVPMVGDETTLRISVAFEKAAG